MDKEDKIKNNKLLLSKLYMKNEFSVRAWMLHHSGAEGRNGSKKADGLASVCVTGLGVDSGRWSQSNRLLVVSGN